MSTQSNRQKVFDKALSHLRKQGRKSMGHIGCAYRGGEGLKCAIGIFIPDRKYRSSMEGCKVNDIISALPIAVTTAGYAFLTAVQERLHDDIPTEDGGLFMEFLEENASILAESYDLKYTPPGGTA